MTKHQCLNELDSIIESTRNQAVYITACNYYDTVSEMSEEAFTTVSDWYYNAINNLKPHNGIMVNRIQLWK